MTNVTFMGSIFKDSEPSDYCSPFGVSYILRLLGITSINELSY
jgi:hypothetical protein